MNSYTDDVLRELRGPCEECGYDSIGEGATVHNMDLDLDTDLIATGYIYTGPPHHLYRGPRIIER